MKSCAPEIITLPDAHLLFHDHADVQILNQLVLENRLTPTAHADKPHMHFIQCRVVANGTSS